jgi:predicted RNase H-like HicB family nuclease
MSEYTVIIEQGLDGYLVASVVELPGCFTQARTKPELLDRIKEAIEVYLDASGEEIPEDHPEFVSVERVVL